MKLLSNKTASSKSVALLNQIRGIRLPLQKKASRGNIDPPLQAQFDRLLDESSSKHFSLEHMEVNDALDLHEYRGQRSPLSAKWEGDCGFSQDAKADFSSDGGDHTTRKKDKRRRDHLRSLSPLKFTGSRDVACKPPVAGNSNSTNVEYVVSLNFSTKDALGNQGGRKAIKKKKSKKRSNRERSRSPSRSGSSCMQLLLLNRVPSERNCNSSLCLFDDSFVSAAEISLESLEDYDKKGE